MRTAPVRRVGRLLILAPPGLTDAAVDTFGAGSEIRVAPLGDPDGPRRDPFRIVERLAGTDADAALVVASRHRGPRNLVPAPVIHGVPTAIVFADRPADLAPLVHARDATWTTTAVCAMGKDRYLTPAAAWIERLREAGRPVMDVRADRVDRDRLCRTLRDGPAVVLYLGHGRARGWAGYQAIRWHHVEAAGPSQPVGFVIAVSCGTLARTRGVVPFGVRWVASGRARAYLGACVGLPVAATLKLGDRITERLATGRDGDVASFLAGLANDIASTGDRDVAGALDAFRLIGDPSCALPTA